MAPEDIDQENKTALQTRALIRAILIRNDVTENDTDRIMGLVDKYAWYRWE